MKFNPNDVVLTPVEVAVDILQHFNPTGRQLDPCKGEGAFYDNMTGDRHWCEISKGVDFFTQSGRFDWIVSNPPYSSFTPFLCHSLMLADNVVYLIPLNKIFSSKAKLQLIRSWGGVKHIRHYGSGRDVGFPFGFAVGAVHFERGYRGPIHESWYPANDNEALA